MVAANYAAQRSELAKSIGLGRGRTVAAAAKRASSDAVVTAPVADAKPASAAAPEAAGRPVRDGTRYIAARPPGSSALRAGPRISRATGGGRSPFACQGTPIPVTSIRRARA